MTASVAPHPVAGIIGGMGPEATVDMMRRVIAATPADDDADHVHMIVDCNPKIPSRIAALIEGTGASPSPELCRMAKSLEASGASFLAMPCNTAHAYFNDIQAAVKIPVLNMPELAAAHLAGLRPANERIGLLASTAVINTRLYDKIFDRIGLTAVYPQEQAGLMEIIRGVKRGEVGPVARDQFVQIASRLYRDQCDVLLIACTELSVLADALGRTQKVVDATDILVAEVIRRAKQAGGR